MPNIKITECPRDAMQGIKTFIPTREKIDYLNALLKVGFDILDFGSFVSPKAIPQMKDTKDVVPQLNLDDTHTKLLAIVANERGAQEAASFNEISLLGYPFSISPTFLQKNINSTLVEAFKRAGSLNTICQRNNKQLVTYISMAFGNPYDDEWNEEFLLYWIKKLHQEGISLISLADTVGLASAKRISDCYYLCKLEFPNIEFGLHLHTTIDGVQGKLTAAYENGCRRFDSVLDGLGGCPMAGTDLVGNVNTYSLIEFLNEQKEVLSLDLDALKKAQAKAPHYL